MTINTSKSNPEKLTEKQILSKIKYLEDSIKTISSGLCTNRERRIQVLKSYL